MDQPWLYIILSKLVILLQIELKPENPPLLAASTKLRSWGKASLSIQLIRATFLSFIRVVLRQKTSQNLNDTPQFTTPQVEVDTSMQHLVPPANSLRTSTPWTRKGSLRSPWCLSPIEFLLQQMRLSKIKMTIFHLAWYNSAKMKKSMKINSLSLLMGHLEGLREVKTSCKRIPPRLE